MSTTTKSNGNDSKYAKAVNEARAKEAEEAAGHEPEAAMAVLPKEAQAMVLKPSQQDINEMMADEEMEFAPQVKKIEEGEMIVGILEGIRPPVRDATPTHPQGRPVTNHVNTWIICHPNGSIWMSILSSVQLDKKLKPFIGSLVKIHRGKEVKTGTAGRRVTEYTVCGPKLAQRQAALVGRRLAARGDSTRRAGRSTRPSCRPASPELCPGARTLGVTCVAGECRHCGCSCAAGPGRRHRGDGPALAGARRGGRCVRASHRLR